MNLNLRKSSQLASAIVVALSFGIATQSTNGQLSSYTQDFEALNLADPGALGADGWLVFGNVFDGSNGNYLYGYGPFSAPNGQPSGGFCDIAAGEGGAEQGAQQLNTYNDYNNHAEHTNGNLVEANIFQEQTIAAGDVGTSWTFAFDAKLGNLSGNTTAVAFIKTIDPNNGFALTNFITADMTSIPTTWGGFSVSIDIDSGLVGQLLQFGFLSTATNFDGSGVFYDNVNFSQSMDPSIATADSYQVLLGTPSGGTLDDTFTSDDSRLCTLTGHAFSPFLPSLITEFQSTLATDSPSALSVTVESQTNDLGIDQEIQCFNYNTGQFETVDTRDATINVDQVVTVALGGDVTRFVEPGTGAVRMRVNYKSDGTGFFAQWQTCIDHLYWEYE